MNSVFVYARIYLGIPTDWNFAIGGPAGLLHDPWNIRLLPHYGLGVFFILAHMLSGLRVVALAHGLERRSADRLWWLGVAISAVIAAAIIAGMCGVRLRTEAIASVAALSHRDDLEAPSIRMSSLADQQHRSAPCTRPIGSN
jgi:hypothetical protein